MVSLLLPVKHHQGQFVVRTASLADADQISRYYVQNRQYLAKWEPAREEAFYTQAHWLKRLKQFQKLYARGQRFHFVIVDCSSQNIVGSISYTDFTRDKVTSCVLGYSLAEAYQGRGVMSNALKLTNQWIFAKRGVQRINAYFMAENMRSAQLLNRLHFTLIPNQFRKLSIKGVAKTHLCMQLNSPCQLHCKSVGNSFQPRFGLTYRNN